MIYDNPRQRHIRRHDCYFRGSDTEYGGLVAVGDVDGLAAVIRALRGVTGDLSWAANTQAARDCRRRCHGEPEREAAAVVRRGLDAGRRTKRRSRQTESHGGISWTKGRA